MFCPRLAAGTGDPGDAFKKQWIYHLCIHPSDVDELFAAYDRMAVFAGKDGVINMILQSIGLPKQNLINTEGAIILGMIYNFLPFMVLPIYNSLIKIPQDTFDAAKDLGANWIQTLWRITLPQILPGIVSGITMVFVPAMTTFVISNLLGGAKINLIGNVIEQEFTTANNWYGGAGLSIVLMILILGSMAVMSHFDKEGEGAAIW